AGLRSAVTRARATARATRAPRPTPRSADSWVTTPASPPGPAEPCTWCGRTLATRAEAAPFRTRTSSSSRPRRRRTCCTRAQEAGRWTGLLSLACYRDPRHESSPGASRSARPAKHSQRAQGVPAAGPAFAFVHVELEIADPRVDHFALVRVLERPSALGVTLGADQVDGLGHTRIGRHARRAQVVEPAQRVVVPAGREREQGEGRIDQLAGREPAQHR